MNIKFMVSSADLHITVYGDKIVMWHFTEPVYYYLAVKC